MANDISIRFLEAYDYLKNKKKVSNAADFAQKIDISSSLMNEILKERTNAGINPIQKTVKAFPEIDAEYLLTGNGFITKSKSEKKTNDLNVSNNVSKIVDKRKVKKTPTNESLPVVAESRSGNNERGVPLIPIDAMAGFGTGAVQVMDYDTETYVVPEFTELNVDFMIRVKGSSMYPKYNSGDLVACKKLALNDIFFQWNKVYVLDTEQGALIKRVKKSEKPKCITLVSENPSYDPFELSLSEINAIALVVGVIRLE